jgi:hypothetical protein
LRAIVKFVGTKQKAPAGAVNCFYYWGDVVIQMDRSTLVVEADDSATATPGEKSKDQDTASGGPKPRRDEGKNQDEKKADVKEGAGSAATKDEKNDTPPSVTVLTGREENWFLSGDVLVKAQNSSSTLFL